jgi:glutamate N-acetyltransferase/amino-acid N-acetyltransferase
MNAVLEETSPTLLIEGNATSPKGFRAAGVHCGVKREKPDLALLVSDIPASAAGVFTTNKVKAAPVRYTQGAVAAGRAQAIVVISGNANACSGGAGLADSEELALLSAGSLGLAADLLMVA